MKYASLCSGIGAPDLAADLLGWECQFQSEIDPFASKVLEHHFPNTPTYGDFTREINTQEWMDSIKCLVAGPPCQSFSNAGKRGGTEDARGNLSIEYLRLCREIGAKWAVFENVPGLSTRDFGHILNAGTGRTDLHRYRHWPNAGIIETGPSGYSACWRYFDAQYFGVPQRRRRLFAIFYLGSWHRPAAVLFGGEGGEGHIAPSSQQKEGVASSAGDGTEGGGGRAYGLMGNVIGRKDSNGPNGGWIQDEKAPTITCIDTPAVCYSSYGQDSRYRHFGDKTPALAAKMGTGGGNVPMVLANTGGKATVGIDVVPTITAREGNDKPIVLSAARQAGLHAGDKPASIDCEPHSTAVLADTELRYLTMTEVERCFGLPDGWTKVGRASKSGRYRVLGNSIVVPVIRWILERIEAAD